MCACACIHRHTHTEACILQLMGVCWRGGVRTHAWVCVQKEREWQSNCYSKLGLTITVWLRYTVKLIHSYYYKLSNCSQKINWSYLSTHGLLCWTHHWDWACRSVTSAVSAYFLLVRRMSAQMPCWLWSENCRAWPVERMGYYGAQNTKLNSLLSHLLWLTLRNSSVLDYVFDGKNQVWFKCYFS